MLRHFARNWLVLRRQIIGCGEHRWVGRVHRWAFGISVHRPRSFELPPDPVDVIDTVFTSRGDVPRAENKHHDVPAGAFRRISTFQSVHGESCTVFKHMVDMTVRLHQIPNPFGIPVLDVVDLLLIARATFSHALYLGPDGRNDRSFFVAGPWTVRCRQQGEGLLSIPVHAVWIHFAIANESNRLFRLFVLQGLSFVVWQ